MAYNAKPSLVKPSLSRRGFMVGCSSAIAAMAGAKLSYLAFGSPEGEPTNEILVTIFLRGGMDGLTTVPVIAGPDRAVYESRRTDIAVPTTGDNAALPLNDLFGLHPAGAPLHELYQDGKVAVVQAAGMPDANRSHFDAMAEMELGTPGIKTGHTGWLTRHLQSAASIPDDARIPALAVGSLQPRSLGGSTEAIGINSPQDFAFSGNWRYENLQRSALRKIYGGASWIDVAGTQTLDAVDVLEFGQPGAYEPSNGADYGNDSLSRNLRSVAQMIKLQLGMQIATIDYGGWDTHEYQGNGGTGYFSDHFGRVASALNAFYTDLNGGPNGANDGHRVTTVVMSEFGRSLKQNGSRGTDHGHGNVMFVMGNNVNGGQVYGPWPGLQPDQLYENRDLAIATDYRQVLSEILIRRFENPNLGTVFPGYADYAPLGIMAGTDLTPVYGNSVATPGPATATPTNTPESGTVLKPPTPTSVPMDTPTPVPNNPDVPTSNATATPTSVAPGGNSVEPAVYVPLVSN